ncbi:DNA topoisomerase 6 subunit B [Morella rubra]|uniref:DNA topoisomerase 6 subunit B n=1 Tax=Morella rubra TaxID=262757 RepID=A0A6A1VEV5_9ROSI|nr:DNA topoisomerase 6 subunit B [Morella rubra]
MKKELYDDYETAKAREKRLGKEARAQEIQAKNATPGKKVKEPPVSKGMEGSRGSFLLQGDLQGVIGFPSQPSSPLFAWS